MGQIEETGRLADGLVLDDDTGILDGHQPATKRNQARPEALVQLEK
jgi:hypothetical protein